MGKHNKKHKSNTKKIILIVVLSIILAALLMVFVIPDLLYRLNGGTEEDVMLPEETAESTVLEETQAEEVTVPEETQAQVEALAFPIVLADGKISIDSIFPYSGVNPDSEGQDVSDIIAVNVTNLSGQYLEQAVLAVTLMDGATATITVSDLPAEKSVTVFSADNQPYVECAIISAEAAFLDASIPDVLSVSVEGLTVTVTNDSSEALSNIDVYCRDILGESYFGSTVYKHTINELPAGQSATIDVIDSLVGMIEVVRIAINES